MSHTPGPWHVTRHWSVGPRSQEDDQSYGMVVPIADVFGDNRDADARLIAAAPLLLEALEDLLDVYEPFDRFKEAAREAVAAVRGQGTSQPAATNAAPAVPSKPDDTPVSDQPSEHNIQSQ